MAQASRTFRVFVSSTFHDLKEERNALQEKVFPRLRELCMQHGARFQAIDLRWGVSEQASLDQQAMNICLGEIARCQKTTPRPNFIVLLGDRYGWRPLPAEIPADEFEEIERRVADDADRALLATWYKRDGNAVPAEYCLQARTGQFEDYDVWEGQVERPLLNVLLQATAEMTLTDEQRLKYIASATAQEIAHGALQVEDARDHVFCFFRTIKDLPQDETAKGFRDLDEEGNPDNEASQQLEDLKDQLRSLLPDNVHEYEAGWTGSGASTDQVEQMCDDVYERLSQVILEEVGAFILEEVGPPEEADPLELEIGEHHKFGIDRAKFFVGREEILETIRNYLKGAAPRPLAVWGESGSGKSALTAKAVQQAIEMHPDAELVSRFIGATPDSSNGRALLESLCRQICRCYDADESSVPADYRELVEEFPKRLALAREEKPLILLLDALDQLSDADNARNLAWLPAELPEHVRLVVSTLPGECRSALQDKLPAENLTELKPMPSQQGGQLLDLWLQDSRRTLQQHQRDEVLGKFSREGNGLPLYLRLAFEEARRWNSYADPKETTLGADVPGVIRDLLARLSAEGNHGEMLVSRSLGYLAAAKNGLTEDELLDVLSSDVELYAWFLESLYHSPPDLVNCIKEHLDSTPSSRPPGDRDKPVDEKVAEDWLRGLRKDRPRLLDFLSTALGKPAGLRLPVVLWSRLYFDLEAYLTLRSGDGTALLSFYHRQLGEVTAEQHLSGEDKPKRHQSLAEYFGRQPLHVERDEQKTPNLRKLSELPYQQAHAEMWDEVKATLTHFDFLQTKIEAVGPQPLIGDYEETLNAGFDSQPLRLVEGALRLSAHALVQDPAQTAGQLTGRLLSSDLPAIQSLLDQIRSWRRPWLRPLRPSLTPPGGPLIRTLTGHRNWVSGVAVTPDGRRAVSASGHNTLKVWDLDSGTELATLTGHRNWVSGVALTPDGRRAVYAADMTLKVWDLESRTELATLTGHTDDVQGVAVSPDGRRAVSASKDDTLKVWDLDSGTELATLTGHTDWVNAAAITPDGRRGLSASKDDTLKVWDLDSGTELATLTGHTSRVSAVAVTPDGRRAVSASFDDTLKVWNLDSGTELATLTGHRGLVQGVAVTPDGRRAVSASWDHTLKVWDLDSGTELATLTGHTGYVSAVAVTPDGRRAVSASWDTTLKVWDLDSGTELATLTGHRGLVQGVAVTPDGRGAVSADRDTLKLWDLDSGTELGTLTRHSGSLRGVAVTPDGGRAVFACDMTLRVRDLDSGTELATLTGHTDDVEGVAVTPDGRRAVSASKDDTLKVWDLDSGTELATLTGHTGHVYAVAVTPDGRRAVSASKDDTLKVWDLDSGTELATLKGNTFWVNAVAVTPDGRRAVSASDDKTLRVWDLDSGTELATLAGHTGQVLAVAVTPDGARVISGSRDNTLKLWDLDSGTELATLTGHSSDVGAVAVTPDGGRVISGSWDNTLKLWDLDPGTQPATLAAHTDEVTQVAVTPDGRRAVSASKDNTLKVWELDSGTELATLPGHRHVVRAVAVTPDGRRAISASVDRTLKVWDLDSGTELATLTGHTDWVYAVAVTANGRRAVSASYDNTLKLWDLGSATELATLTGHAMPVQAVVVTSDGRRAVSASHDETLKVWDLQSGTEVATLAGHTAWVWEVAITPDGRRAVSASTDKTLKVWELESGTELASLTGHDSSVLAVAVTPDGRRAVSASGDHTLKVWDLDSGAELATLTGHSDVVWAVAVTPDGRLAVSASDDHTLRVWRLRDGTLLATFTGEGAGRSCAVALDRSAIVASDALGRVHVLRLEGIPTFPIGLPILTPHRMWLYGEHGNRGRWADHLTAECHWCGQHFPVPDETLGAITAIIRDANLSPDRSPCLEFPAEAWDEPRLLSECPLCHSPLRFNPFVVDSSEEERLWPEWVNKQELARSLGSQAKTLKDNGDLYQAAIALYRQEEQLRRKLGDKPWLALSLRIRALVFRERGDLVGALALYKEQEDICRELGDDDGLARSLSNQAVLLAKLSKPHDALPLAEEAHSLVTSRGLTSLTQQIEQVLDFVRRKSSQ